MDTNCIFRNTYMINDNYNKIINHQKIIQWLVKQEKDDTFRNEMVSILNRLTNFNSLLKN